MENWKSAVLQNLEELSDSKFQETVWLRHEGELVSSPSEASDELFNDTGLSDELKSGEVFSHLADSLLKELRKSISRINFDQSIAVILSSKEWLEVRELASQALKEVRKAVNAV